MPFSLLEMDISITLAPECLSELRSNSREMANNSSSMWADMAKSSRAIFNSTVDLSSSNRARRDCSKESNSWARKLKISARTL